VPDIQVSDATYAKLLQLPCADRLSDDQIIDRLASRELVLCRMVAGQVATALLKAAQEQPR
jgi:hypothetical protein